MIAMVK